MVFSFLFLVLGLLIPILVVYLMLYLVAVQAVTFKMAAYLIFDIVATFAIETLKKRNASILGV